MEGRLRTDHGEVPYAEGPPGGRPLLLLHGLAARWQVWGPLLPALVDEWHVFALDLRGHGAAARTPGRYHIAEIAGDALEVLRRRIGAPAAVYGHSLGGWVGIWLAARAPERVEALVIGDTAIYPENVDPAEAVSYLENLPLVLRSLAVSLRQLDPEVLEAYREGRMLAGFDPDELLLHVSCPVLLLQADPERGGLMTDDDVRRARARLSHATHATLSALGHGLHVEDADAVLRVVAPFLRSLPSGDPGEGR